MRSYGAKRDANEKAIIRALQSQGWSVFPMSQPGFPDLLCAKMLLKLVEVKDPTKSPSARRLTDEQVAMFTLLEAAGQAVNVATDPMRPTGEPWRDYHRATTQPRPSKKGRAA